ncbi:NepR family anti-sigma factor [Sphingomonas quercus]|uniref:NepR family anti-sigma factor n=1 Tax=Sphingomonas quercus TaxID=2842451 RepID=UPI00209A844A|nr:NepR family anti-sigma factor [Sphingomonas quercus]
MSEISSKATGKTNKPRRAFKNGRPSEAGVGSVLRTIYDQTVKETVPQEMLDLLGKLD